jgi:hypothetical protein
VTRPALGRAQVREVGVFHTVLSARSREGRSARCTPRFTLLSAEPGQEKRAQWQPDRTSRAAERRSGGGQVSPDMVAFVGRLGASE